MHSNISILDYYDLSDEEKAVLRSELREGGLSDEFGDIDTLQEFLNQARSWNESEINDELLVYLEVSRRFSSSKLPADIYEKLEKARAEVERSEVLSRRAGEIGSRIDEILGRIGSERHFERVTGHAIRDLEQAAGAYRGSRRETASAQRPLFRILFMSMAAVLFLGFIYAGLLVATRAGIGPLQREAPAIDLNEYRVPGPMRGEDPFEEARRAAARLHEAAVLLRDARTSTVGLFPRVEEQRVVDAMTLLNEITDAENVDRWFLTEAEYLKGVGSMLLEDGDRAAEHFQRVIDNEGRHSLEAYELIRQIEAVERQR